MEGPHTLEFAEARHTAIPANCVSLYHLLVDNVKSKNRELPRSQTGFPSASSGFGLSL
jgi:hypothetical protein